VPLTPINYWRNLYFTPSELLDPAISGDRADPDSDGINNALEYGFGLHPTLPDAEGRPTGTVEIGPQGISFVLVYRRRTDDPSLSYRIETSSDFATWTLTAPAAWSETVTPLGDGLEKVHARHVTPVAVNARAFFRVQLTINP
jgi:hypothetical protein